MEINVHRYRFADWIPAAITSIAVDQATTGAHQLVAIGRQDGSIEFSGGSEVGHTSHTKLL